MSATTPPPFPRTFTIVIFVLAVVVAAAVIYFGANGTLGAGIP